MGILEFRRGEPLLREALRWPRRLLPQGEENVCDACTKIRSSLLVRASSPSPRVRRTDAARRPSPPEGEGLLSSYDLEAAGVAGDFFEVDAEGFVASGGGVYFEGEGADAAREVEDSVGGEVDGRVVDGEGEAFG